MSIDLNDAHRAPDPTGYQIEHREEGGEVVALVLRRLTDGEVVGEFGDRDSIDAAVAAQAEVSQADG